MNNRFFVTCVGSSAGGLDALREFFSSVDPNTSSAFVVVSHLPHHHHTRLHQILAGVTKMKTHLIDKDTAVEPHHIYVLPGNLRVKIMHDVLIVRERGLHEISNNAIDEFLFSLAEDKGERGIAIILSGLGKDGSQGANAVHKKGGIVLVQDPASALYTNMPIAAIAADHPAEVLTPKELGEVFGECLRVRG
jgi:chemotaxis response regulator CheB